MFLEFAGSLARTASGSAAPLEGMAQLQTLRVQLDVTAAAGTTPSLTVLVEDSIDGTNWNTLASFAAKTGPGREVVNITTPFGPQVRASWTVTGTTPSFTFSVKAHAE